MFSTKFLKDMLERVLWTWFQGFLAVAAVTGRIDRQTLSIAVAAGVASAVKCILATKIGAGDSAATLPVPPTGG